MNKSIFNRKWLLLICLCLISIVVVIFYTRSQDKTRIIDKEIQKIYNLPSSYTIKEAIKDGMVDVTNISDKENVKINNFLIKVEQRNWAILKTIEATNEDLIISIYVFDDRINEIRKWKCFVKAQYNEDPDKCFISAYTTTDNEGITIVYLKNIRNNFPTNNQILKDEVLYSYRNKK